jgi:cytochrome c oxidase accessory protein FixG
MLDDHSLQVTYRYDRGESRGPHKKGASWDGRGDCIDCNACVVACPMGIDIRDGSQLECINCGLCIDACDEIMVKVGRPKGLIAYDSDDGVLARVQKRTPRYPFLRTRTLYYAGALTLVSGLMLWGLLHRTTLDVHALRDRNPTFVRMHDGSIRNGYTLKIANRTFAPMPVTVTFEGVAGARLTSPGEPPTDALRATVKPNEILSLRAFVTAPQDSLTKTSLPAEFEVRTGRMSAEARTVFLSGAANP